LASTHKNAKTAKNVGAVTKAIASDATPLSPTGFVTNTITSVGFTLDKLSADHGTRAITTSSTARQSR
jgi:hypothetical protein